MCLNFILISVVHKLNERQVSSTDVGIELTLKWHTDITNTSIADSAFYLHFTIQGYYITVCIYICYLYVTRWFQNNHTWIKVWVTKVYSNIFCLYCKHVPTVGTKNSSHGLVQSLIPPVDYKQSVLVCGLLMLNNKGFESFEQRTMETCNFEISRPIWVILYMF